MCFKFLTIVQNVTNVDLSWCVVTVENCSTNLQDIIYNIGTPNKVDFFFYQWRYLGDGCVFCMLFQTVGEDMSTVKSSKMNIVDLVGSCTPTKLIVKQSIELACENLCNIGWDSRSLSHLCRVQWKCHVIYWDMWNSHISNPIKIVALAYKILWQSS